LMVRTSAAVAGFSALLALGVGREGIDLTLGLTGNENS